jgi:hypothetical protein
MNIRPFGLSLALALVAAVATSHAEAAAGGYVHGMTGAATLQSADAAPRPLKVGDLVQTGDIVTAAGDGSATVKLEDGQVMLLGVASAFRVTEYRYDKAKMGESRAVFGLLKGALRFITGVLGASHKEVVKVAAGAATIGIRGTDVTVIYDAASGNVTVVVNSGAVDLMTLSGTRTVQAGNFSVATRNAIPSLPLSVRAAPPAVLQTASTMLTMRNVPVNTPVSLEASAAAVAAQAQADELQAKAAASPQDGTLKEQAAQAQQQATQALDAAAAAAQQALQGALDAGGVLPATAAPPVPIAPGPSGAAPAPTEAVLAPLPSVTTTGTATGGTSTGGGGTASPN